VIRQWLDGDTRDKIASDNRIGAGTVSVIINDPSYNGTSTPRLLTPADFVAKWPLRILFYRMIL
jgi:hypothetical protein